MTLNLVRLPIEPALFTAPGGGGGGYFHMYAYWVCAARETPIFSPKFPIRSISFSQMPPKFGPEHHHFIFFAIPETIIFRISLISTHSWPPTAGSALRRHPGLAAGQSASQMRPGSSGDLHFHAQPGSISVRNPAFPRSTQLKLGPEPWGYYLETDPDPVAMVIRVELVIHKPTETNAN